ncbi:MAG TPA: hypothetical protein VFX28_04375, partial [Methylomirabilota bacterium]|nr:hypothetical protein [Methylomirabilota bacterium]
MALAVLSLAVVALVQGFAQGLRLLRVSGEHQQAVLLADQKTREAVKPTPGREEGKEGVFSWERTTKRVEAPDLDVPGRARPWQVYEIDVSVTWSQGRRVQIATLRTVNPTDEAGPA